MTRVRDAFSRWSRMGQDGERNMDTETMQNDSAAQVDVETGSEQEQPSTQDAAQVEEVHAEV